jgi:hypothetical protein
MILTRTAIRLIEDPEITPTVIALFIAGAAILCWSVPTHGLEHDLRGQASAFGEGVNGESGESAKMAVSYIPQVTISQDTDGDTFLDLEASLDAFAAHGSDTASIDLYRLKLRLATPWTETRLGLQQINFGPAYLLRPLRWFDRLDPRDPAGLTEGVYALSLRHVAEGNASLWLWALYGNDEPKGYEMLPTVKGSPEFGGRVQIPILSGEMAFTFHRREVDGPEAISPVPAVKDFPENRLAIDGRWDVEVGLWLESVLIHQRSDDLPFRWAKMMTLGTDYTLPVGNGPYVLLENMLVDSSEKPLKLSQESYLSGLSISYPISYVDRLSAIGIYSWDDEDYSAHLAWDRYWDRLTVSLSLFHYPDTESRAGMGTAVTSAGGTGGRVTVIFNH